MRRTLVVAASELDRAVRTKAFVVSVVLLPVLMVGSIAVQKLAEGQVDTRPRRFVVIDETGRLYEPLAEATRRRNALVQGKAGPFLPDAVSPDGHLPEDARLAISERIRAGELFALVEIPADALDPDAVPPPRIRYYSDHPSYEDLRVWVELAVNEAVRAHRYREARLDPALVARLDRPVASDHLGLIARGAGGRVEPAARVDPLKSVGVPIVLMFMLFMVIMMSAPQLLNTVLEEKMSRVSEILLGSIRPFELMLGKLAGSAGVSLILAVLYLGGGIAVVTYLGKGDAVSPALVGTFFLFLVLAVFLFGSLFIAIGAAVTDLKDAQSLMTPVMLVAMIPMFTWTAVLKAPSSAFAVGMSLFPPAAPFLMMLRVSLHPGPPVWQVALAVVLTAATTVGFVYAAGRIFRVGLLLQGKSASLGQMVRWIFR